jgi:hypothetical protein
MATSASSFNPATYDALQQKIQDALQKIISGTNRFIQSVENAANSIPIIGGLLGDAASALLGKLRDLVQDGVNKVETFLRPFAVPPWMWHDGNTWATIGNQAGGVASTLSGQIEANGNEWAGLAGGKYAKGVPDQVSAAQGIASLSSTVEGACDSIAVGGFAFYTSIAATLIGFIAAGIMIATGVAALPGLITAALSLIIGVSGALASLHFGVESGTRTLQTVVRGNSSFPGGSWPVATAQ